MNKFAKLHRNIAILVIGSIVFSPVASLARSITLDEATFNQIVTRAKEADILEEQAKFYKDKYEAAVEKANSLAASYKETIDFKDAVISEQEALVKLNMERLNNKDEIINLQEEQIKAMKKRKTFRDFFISVLAVGGAVIAHNNDEDGAALGLGLTGLFTILIK